MDLHAGSAKVHRGRLASGKHLQIQGMQGSPPLVRRVQMGGMFRASIFLSSVLVAGVWGCASTEEGEFEEADLTSFSVRLSAGTEPDTWRAKVGTEDLVCTKGLESPEGQRLDCRHGTHLLEVVLRPSDAFAIDWPEGRRGRKRSTHLCSRPGNTPMPSSLRCTKAPPRTSAGGLSSPFASEVPNFPVPNAHTIGQDTGLFRSMGPRSEADLMAIRDLGVKAVLIFKNKTGDGHEVDDEMEWLSAEGIQVTNIPFVWKDLPDFKTSCEQTVDALKFLQTARKARKKALVHCTVGEDRTGYLAALERLLVEGGEVANVFQSEMCERGYGAGNPQKPGFVVGSVEDELTPLYQKMAMLIASGTLTTRLSRTACATEPAIQPDPALVCGTSTRFVP